MKNRIQFYILLLVGIICLASCKKKELTPVDVPAFEEVIRIDSSFGGDFSFCPNTSVRMQMVAPVDSFLWLDQGIWNSDLVITDPGSYSLQVFIGASSQLHVYEMKAFEKDYLIPDFVSPNGDGVNEEFVIVNNCLSAVDLQVFDLMNDSRVVFESDDLDVAWDLTYEGKYLPFGTYSYLITTTDFAGNRKQENDFFELVY